MYDNIVLIEMMEIFEGTTERAKLCSQRLRECNLLTSYGDINSIRNVSKGMNIRFKSL